MQQAFIIKADPADLLPASAAAHLEALRQGAANAHAVLASTNDTLREQLGAKTDSEKRRDQLRPEDPLVLAEDKKIERIAASIAPLQKAREKHEADWQQTRGLVSVARHGKLPPRRHEELPPPLDNRGESE